MSDKGCCSKTIFTGLGRSKLLVLQISLPQSSAVDMTGVDTAWPDSTDLCKRRHFDDRRAYDNEN